MEGAESDAAALVRELHEELAVTIDPPAGAPLGVVAVPEFTMPVWVVRRWAGVPVNAAPAEHAAIGWYGPDALGALDLALEDYRPLLAAAVASGHGRGRA